MSEVLISVCWWSLGCTLPEPPGPAAEMVSYPPRGERAPREGISSTVFGVLVVFGVTLPEPPGPAAEMVSVLVACAADTSTMRFGTWGVWFRVCLVKSATNAPSLELFFYYLYRE